MEDGKSLLSLLHDPPSRNHLLHAPFAICSDYADGMEYAPSIASADEGLGVSPAQQVAPPVSARGPSGAIHTKTTPGSGPLGSLLHMDMYTPREEHTGKSAQVCQRCFYFLSTGLGLWGNQ